MKNLYLNQTKQSRENLSIEDKKCHIRENGMLYFSSSSSTHDTNRDSEESLWSIIEQNMDSIVIGKTVNDYSLISKKISS